MTLWKLSPEDARQLVESGRKISGKSIQKIARSTPAQTNEPTIAFLGKESAGKTWTLFQDATETAMKVWRVESAEAASYDGYLYYRGASAPSNSEDGLYLCNIIDGRAWVSSLVYVDASYSVATHSTAGETFFTISTQNSLAIQHI